MTPFFSAGRYMIGPLFSTKSIWLTQVFLIGIWKAPLFLTSRCMHIFFTQRFLRLLVLLVFNELTVLFVLLPAINGDKKINRQLYEWVNISDDLVYEWVRFFKGKVYEWGRFWNTGSHTRTKITPPPFPPAPTRPRGKEAGGQQTSHYRLCKGNRDTWRGGNYQNVSRPLLKGVSSKKNVFVPFGDQIYSF